MIRTFGLALAMGALVLSACTGPSSPQPSAQPQAPAADAAPGVPPPQLTALPATGCVAPTPGTVTIRRGETVSRGSMQLYFKGRDETYRTDPHVYMFDSNAGLRNRNNTRRNATFFGLWRGHVQTAEACGQTVRMSLVRANLEEATIRVRR